MHYLSILFTYRKPSQCSLIHSTCQLPFYSSSSSHIFIHNYSFVTSHRTSQTRTSRTFIFSFLSALLIPHASPPYKGVVTITSHIYLFDFILRKEYFTVLLSTIFSAHHVLYPSFKLCPISLSHPPSAATCDPRYLKQSTSSNGSPL